MKFSLCPLTSSIAAATISLTALVQLADAATNFDTSAPKLSCGSPAIGAISNPGKPILLNDPSNSLIRDPAYPDNGAMSALDTTWGERIVLLKPIGAVAEPAGNTLTVTSGNTTDANGTSVSTGGIDLNLLHSLSRKDRLCIFSTWTSPLSDKQAGGGFYYPLGRSIAIQGVNYNNIATNDTVYDAEFDEDGVLIEEARSSSLPRGNDWTAPSGKASQNNRNKISYLCDIAANVGDYGQFSQGEYLCQVKLPMTSYRNGDGSWNELNLPYYLTYYEREMTGSDDASPNPNPGPSGVRTEISRFLQKTTFGPTDEELDALEAAFADIMLSDDKLTYAEAMEMLQTEWIASQMDSSIIDGSPDGIAGSDKFVGTSLRAFWRRRLNPHAFEVYPQAESGPHPCEALSRWRRYAFTLYDVQLSQKGLRWGMQNMGGIVQQEPGHKVTVETVNIADTSALTEPTASPAPSLAPSSSLLPSVSSAPSLLPTRFPTKHPTLSPSKGETNSPTLSSAPTSSNLIGFGGMEGGEWGVIQAWPSSCTRSVVALDTSTYPITASDANNELPGSASDPNYGLVTEGVQSMKVDGGRCFVFRQLGNADGSTCIASRVTDSVAAGDTLRIKFKVRVDQPNTVFHVYTGHFHKNKVVKWAIPKDDSHIVSRTLIETANEWVEVSAVHTVGPDWTFPINGIQQVLTPALCNHYQLRFRTTNSVSGFYLDDVRVEKVGVGGEDGLRDGMSSLGMGTADGGSVAADDLVAGFMANPNFIMDHKYWKYSPQAGHIEFDPTIRRNVMVLKRGKVLRQNVLANAIPNKNYKFGFWVKLKNTGEVSLQITLRLRFRNNDRVNGPCKRKICNLIERPFKGKIVDDALTQGLADGSNSNGEGDWFQVISDDFTMFGDFNTWDGKVDFIIFQMNTRNMPAGAEISVANFEMSEELSVAPSTSLAPSSSPSSLVVDNVAYIVRYANQFRTIVRHPFQVDNTGEILPMDGSVEYTLCDVDEIEGRKLNGELYPAKLNFLIDGKCKPIRGGNPTIDLDPQFVDSTILDSLHILNLTNHVNSSQFVPINEEMTLGGDWLLQTSIEEEFPDECSALPTPYDNDYRGKDDFNPDASPSRFNPDSSVVAYLGPEEGFVMYDPRLLFRENSLSSPLLDGGGSSVVRSTLRAGSLTTRPAGGGTYVVMNDKNIAQCTNELPNFFNRESCQISYDENACQKQDKQENVMVDVQMAITLNEETLAQIHGYGGRYIYAVDGLRYDETNTHENRTLSLPCEVKKNPQSRWIPTDLSEESCVNELQENTTTLLQTLLENSNDNNPLLRDIIVWNNHDEDGCDPLDFNSHSMLIWTSNEGICWQNVHPDHLSVFDMTSYVEEHMANSTMTNAITQFDSTGILLYPENHEMAWWEALREDEYVLLRMGVETIKRLSRLGDSFIVDQFADAVGLNKDANVLRGLAQDLAEVKVGNQIQKNRGGGVLMCGSPNEVSPDPTLTDYFDIPQADLDCQGCQDSYGNYFSQKQTVWLLNALSSPDQLCQRMAWALYELLNVGPTTNPDNTETNLYTYDIFTRNCFGTYGDLLKEMTFSPKMGEQFNFLESTSVRFSFDTWNRVSVKKLVYPDENFAREIMQLYTIGLHELQDDGTETRDAFGRVIQTYNNYDILTNARLFTGFEYTAKRGNTEELFRANKSRMSPTRIDIDKHDFFPKTTVSGGWLGDRYPLCEDLPQHHFLKPGAKYIFRGGSSQPTAHFSHKTWDYNNVIKRFVLDKNSALYGKLCNSDAAGDCQFANTVELNEIIPCYGKECRVDTLVVVQVAAGAFYEYLRPPCTNLFFHPQSVKVYAGWSGSILNVGRQYSHIMCANPRNNIASRSCCNATLERSLVDSRAETHFMFEYSGEVVTAKTNAETCEAYGGVVCDPGSLMANQALHKRTLFGVDDPLLNIRARYNDVYPSHNTFYWTNSSCTFAVKVRMDAMIAIIHEPESNPLVEETVTPFVGEESTVNFIKVPWETDPLTQEEIYPTPDNDCGNLGSPVGPCSMTDDEMCLCPVEVNVTTVYDVLPTRDEVLSNLFIGAFDPSNYNDTDGSYVLLESSDDVKAYSLTSINAIDDTSTIFEVTDEFGDIVYFKNMHSSVTIGKQYIIRNPVGFIDLVKVEGRDAEYEIEAFLKSLLRYPTAAPYISKKIIQYFGISNPAPSYVQRVTQAFRTGTFENQGITFGTGHYGDLAAVAAAITLDRDNLSPVTDEDPTNGNIREPLLKLVHVLRSLSFQRRPHVPLRYGLIEGLDSKIGQVVFEPPDQFSFFSSDYSPPGIYANIDMVSPESQLLSMSSIIGLTNGFFSLINYGLAFGDGGFGPNIARRPLAGDYSSSVGILSYQPAGDLLSKIEHLSTLLTGGRLSDANKQVLANAYGYFLGANGDEVAERILLQLMTIAPEFHSSNTIRKTGSPRLPTPAATPNDEPYKAIVYINLFGGVDSFNILTPHSANGCYLYDEYYQARGGTGGIGLTMDEILPIDGSSAGIEGCETFGVNAMLPVLKNIYDQGKGIFLANTGHLHKPVTQSNWLTETRTDLFSHHTMKKEAHQVDAFNEADGTGILGRLLDVLQGYGQAVSATAINTKALMVEGSPSTGRLPDVLSSAKILRVFERNFLKGTDQQLRDFLADMHSETTMNSGIYADTWSQSFIDVWNKTDTLVDILRSVNLATDFKRGALDFGAISSQMKLVAEMISIRNQRGNGLNRDVFYVQMGGFDGHSNLADIMAMKLPSLNAAIESFWAEMKAQGLENQVTVIQGSEFGRTINANSNKGSDHAWGGNYFMFGGDVLGGRILGEYPDSFLESYHRNIGRGRLIPSRSWDALWYGVAQWFGITDQADLDWALPNSQNFGCDLFTDTDLFLSGSQSLTGCGGPSYTTDSISFEVPEPRLLTGEEQKDVCKMAKSTFSETFSIDASESRCYVDTMVVANTTETSSGRRLAEGQYEVTSTAVLNFDGAITPEQVPLSQVEAAAAAAAVAASQFIIVGATPKSMAPSVAPSSAPPTYEGQTPEPTLSPSTSPTLASYCNTEGQASIELRELGSLFMGSDVGETAKTGYSCQTASTARWLEQDGGNNHRSLGGLITIEGSGKDIWKRRDEFHFSYLKTSGDFSFTVKINSLSAPHGWTKGGIMVRSSLEDNSPHYSLFLTGSNGLANQYRSCRNCYTGHSNLYSDWTRPESVWLKVTKAGNVLSSSFMHVGSSTWQPFGTVKLMSFRKEFYVGLAVTSHQDGKIATMVASDISLSRECSAAFISPEQCVTSSNCEWGWFGNKCYNYGELPESEQGEFVHSIVDPGSTMQRHGCSSSIDKPHDGTTDKYFCDRTGWLGDNAVRHRVIFYPSHGRLTIVKKIRVYAANNNPSADPTHYKLFGRMPGQSHLEWVDIVQGDLIWPSADRNSLGTPISSTFERGDESLNYVEINLFNNNMAYVEYKLRIETDDWANDPVIQFAEVELPGIMLTLPHEAAIESSDVGGVNAAGTVNYEGPGSWLIKASGADIYGTTDSFHYMYYNFPLSQDGTAVVFVEDFQYIHQHSKAGLMIRESLAADSPHYSIFVKGSAMELVWLHRGATGQSTANTAFASRLTYESYRMWLKIEKHGNYAFVYHKCEGCSSWVLYDAKVLNFSQSSFYVGVAACSHVNGEIVPLTVSNFEVSVAEPSGPAPSCIAWRQTGLCSPSGPREPWADQSCDTTIVPDWSGYCDCTDSTIGFGCGHVYLTCENVCFQNLVLSKS